jgi:hypothetical protein
MTTPVLPPPTWPGNAALPAKHAALVKLISGLHPTDPIPLDTSVALVGDGFMRVGVPEVAGDLATAGDHVFDSSDAAADLCLRVLSSILTAQAGGLLNASQVAELRRMAASDFAKSAIYALRCTGVELNQLCSLISSAAQLSYPELRDELLAGGMLDALAESLVMLAARMGPGETFPRVEAPVAPRAVAKTPGTAVTPSRATSAKVAERFEAAAGADKHLSGGTFYPESECTTDATPVETCPEQRSSIIPFVVPASSKTSDDGEWEARINPLVPKLAFQNMWRLAGYAKAPNLGITRSTRRTLARSNFAENESSATRSSILTSQGTADALESGECGTGGAIVWTAPCELRAVARNVGETLLMADFSAILAHNRRCRRNSSAFVGEENAEITEGTHAGDFTSSPTKLETSVKFPAATSSLGKASTENVACSVLDAVKALSPSGLCSAGPLTGNYRNDWTLMKSDLSVDQYPARLMSALSAMLCAHHLGRPFQSDTSMRDGCISALVAYRTPLKHECPGDVDPLLLRLRGHIQLIYENVTSSRSGVTAEDEETTERLLRLLGDYVRAATNLGQSEFAVVSEVLVCARSIFVVGAAGLRPAAWRSQRLRAADAWVGAASDIASRVNGNGDHSLSAELLVSLLLGRQSTLAWVYEYADHVLFSENAFMSPGGARFGPGISFNAHEKVPVRRRTLSYFMLSMKLVAVAFPPAVGVRDSTSHDRGETCNSDHCENARALTLLSQLDLVMKPETGFVARILAGGGSHERSTRDDPLSTASSHFIPTDNVGIPSQPLEVCTAALLLAETAFSAPATPFLSSRVLIDTHAHNHFLSVLRLYNSPDGHGVQLSEAWTDLVMGHLRVLMVMTRAEELGNSHCSSISCHNRRVHDKALHQLQINLESSVCTGLSGCGDGRNMTIGAVAQSFHRLHVLDFIVREINLEYEISQRISRGGKETDATPSEVPSTQATAEGEDVSVKLRPMQGDAMSTLRPETPHMLSMVGSKPSIPALKLEQKISKSDTAVDHGNVGVSEPADVRKYRGPTIPKLGLNLGKHSDGIPQRAFANIPSDDSSDDDRPTRGFIGDLMEDVAREEALEEMGMVLGGETVSDEKTIRTALGENLTDGAASSGDALAGIEQQKGKNDNDTTVAEQSVVHHQNDEVRQDTVGFTAADPGVGEDCAQHFVEVDDGEEAAAAVAAEDALQSTLFIDDHIVGGGKGESLALTPEDCDWATSHDTLDQFGDNLDTSYVTMCEDDGDESFVTDLADEYASTSVLEGQVVCEAYDGQLHSQENNLTVRRRQQEDQHNLTSSRKPWSVDSSTRVMATSRPPSLLVASTEALLQPARMQNTSNTTSTPFSRFQHSNKNPPSRQMRMDGGANEKENAQAMDKAQKTDSTAEIIYANERGKRRLYHNERVHVTMLELLLALLVGVDRKTRKSGVDSISGAAGDVGNDHSSQVYATQHATQLQLHNHKQNVTFFLRVHLNHTDNASIIAMITSAAATLGRGAERLLRLSCDALFRPGRYAARKLVARGAYAQVHRCSLPAELGTLFPSEVALKIVDTPQNTHEPASAVDVYSEIALLEAMAQDPWVAKLYYYGVAGESFYIVMQHYPASLKQWRTAHGHKFDDGEITLRMPLYLGMYSQCIEAVSALEKYGVVHYDVKADNFLLEPLPGCSADEFWNPRGDTHNPPFHVVVTDFGESRMFVAGDTAGTVHNRGTEYIKSPEMLTISNASKKDVKGYDRRKYHKCGRPSDVWALGCLLYEILTNAYM